MKVADEIKRPRRFYSGRYVLMVTIAIGLMFFAMVPILWLLGVRGFDLVYPAMSGIIFISIGAFYFLKYRDTAVTDERDRRDTYKAFTFSWFTTWIFLIGLFFLKNNNVFNISADLIILVVWFSMPWTCLIFKAILSRSGDMQ